MYYIFRTKTTSSTKEAKKTKNNSAKATKLAVIFGSSMGSILINQMQIVAIILSKIAWSPDLPRWLINILIFVSNLITFDISVMFGSPECVADVQPLDKWLFSLLLPLCFALLFVVWYGMAKCHFARKKRYDKVVAQTILQCVVNVLLIGLYTTVIKTCLQVFDCSDDLLILDPRLRCDDSQVTELQVIAGVTFVMWGIVPFLILMVQLCRHRYRKGLEEHMEESDTFRIMYGWAIKKYRLDDRLVAFLWEIVNASTKVMMVAGSVLMFPKTRTIFHAVTIGTSMVLHGWIRPYKDKLGNLMVVVFCGIDLFSILGSPAESSPIIQGAFILTTFTALLVVIFFLVKSLRTAVAAKRKQALTGNTDDHLTPLERKLLRPLLVLFVWPFHKIMSLSVAKHTTTKTLPIETADNGKDDFTEGEEKSNIHNKSKVEANKGGAKTKVMPVTKNLPPTKLIVKIIDGPHKGQVSEYSLHVPVQILIGNDDEECNLVLDKDEEISGEHAAICWDVKKEMLIFVDRDSTNGSKVNGKPAEADISVVLESEDEIEVGESRLVVLLSQEVVPVTNEIT